MGADDDQPVRIIGLVHSDRRSALNVVGYKNPAVDKTNELNGATDPDKRKRSLPVRGGDCRRSAVRHPLLRRGIYVARRHDQWLYQKGQGISASCLSSRRPGHRR
jgi:hypothetical protein